MKKDIPYKKIARYITGNCSPKEAEQVTSWIDETKENQLKFNELYEIWEQTGQLKEFDEYDVDLALKNVSSKLNDNLKKIPVKGLFIPVWIKIAAGFILIAALSYLFISRIGESGMKMITYSTMDEIKRVQLNDGSVLWLNKNSEIQCPEKFRKNIRNVSLKGEVYFEITKDASSPFVINTPEAAVKVLGTSFNVMAREETGKTVVTVETGIIEFETKSNISMKIKKGEMITLENISGKLEKKVIDDPNILSWKTGNLTFKNTPFKKAIEDISNYYQKEIKIVDTTLYNQKFNAYFEKQTFDVILNVLRMNRNLEIHDSSGIILIVKK